MEQVEATQGQPERRDWQVQGCGSLPKMGCWPARYGLVLWALGRVQRKTSVLSSGY